LNKAESGLLLVGRSELFWRARTSAKSFSDFCKIFLAFNSDKVKTGLLLSSGSAVHADPFLSQEQDQKVADQDLADLYCHLGA
jgi:hypothetical protein